MQAQLQLTIIESGIPMTSIYYHNLHHGKPLFSIVAFINYDCLIEVLEGFRVVYLYWWAALFCWMCLNSYIIRSCFLDTCSGRLYISINRCVSGVLKSFASANPNRFHKFDLHLRVVSFWYVPIKADPARIAHGWCRFYKNQSTQLWLCKLSPSICVSILILKWLIRCLLSVIFTRGISSRLWPNIYVIHKSLTATWTMQTVVITN